MAEQQRVGAPYGDVFFVTTPSLDRTAQQLYLQQKTREANQQRENQALDQMMQKDFANIRAVDTPDVVKSYNDYKALKKNLYFNKDLQRDPLKYNQAQQLANQAFVDMQNQINRSKEIKEMTKTMTTDRFKNPDAYADDYGQRASILMNTPISNLQNHPQYGDLTNWDNYRYQGSNTNFNDIVNKVYGKPNKIVGKEEPLDKLGLQFRSPVYEYGTPPAQVYEGLVNSLDHKTERDAAFKWKQLSPDVIQKVEEDYAKIPQQKWEQMGLSGPQKIDLRGGSDAEKYMRLLSMQNAINTNPRLVNYENRTSEKAKLDFNFNKALVLEGVRHGNRVSEIKLRDELKKKGEGEQDDIMDELYDQLKSDALSNPKKYKPGGGTPFHQYQIKTTEGVKKLFAVTDAKGHKIYPDEIRFSKDFGNVVPIFLEHYTNSKGDPLPEIVKDKDGNAKVLNDLSQPILESEFKQRWKKEIMGGEAYGKSLKNKSAAKPITKTKDPLGLF